MKIVNKSGVAPMRLLFRNVDRMEVPVTPTAQRLPADILIEIFTQCLPKSHMLRPSDRDGPLVLTWVCQSWRSTALYCPALWNALSVMQKKAFTPPQAKILDTWINRSGSSLLSIQIHHCDGPCRDGKAARHILSHHFRLRALHLYSNYEKTLCKCFVQVLDHLASSKQLRQMVDFRLTRTYPHQNPLAEVSVDLSYAHHLSTVHLGGYVMVDLRLSSDRFYAMRELRIASCEPMTCLLIFDRCPSLEILEIKCIHEQSLNPPFSNRRARKLHTLLLDAHPNFIRHILQHVNMPSLLNLSLSSERGFIDGQLFTQQGYHLESIHISGALLIPHTLVVILRQMPSLKSLSVVGSVFASEVMLDALANLEEPLCSHIEEIQILGPSHTRQPSLCTVLCHWRNYIFKRGGTQTIVVIAPAYIVRSLKYSTNDSRERTGLPDMNVVELDRGRSWWERKVPAVFTL